MSDSHTSAGKRKQGARPPVVSLVNLGCAKNQVDSERILGQLAENGFLISQEPTQSDLCLVNTCGFIHDAREETASVIRELSASKRRGRPRTVVALGCMVERAADASELGRFLDAADARLGFQDYPRLHEICQELIEAAQEGRSAVDGGRAYVDIPGESPAKKKVPESYNAFLESPRIRIGSNHTAYLKISEGCNNPCRFCSIPRIRGLQVSRPIEELVAEAKNLVDGGCKEINLIAQDTTSYGQDLYGKHRLADLLRSLRDDVKADVWFRLMYAYPKHLDEEMLEVLASDPRFCPYIDLPLQHINDRVLGEMARGVTAKDTMELLDLIERKLPGAAVRTAFIVGYPGETESEFEELLAFVASGRFTHAGVFLYSEEPMTLAARSEDSVQAEEKERRREAIMLAQRQVSREKQKQRLKQRLDVLVDAPLPKGAEAPKGARSVARSQFEAPEVDGVVFLRGAGTRKLAPGTVLSARVVRALDYDIVAEPGR